MIIKNGWINMKGYWIALYKKINNPDNLKKYGEIVTPIIKNFGGKPLIRGGKYRCLEGDDFPRTVVWEFPNYEKAIQCHNSKEYQEGWKLAKNTTERSLQIIEGFSTE
tara:strand:- start:215 stop:538 length:324 start_codon:yes stop_codon:yes gene_type:complete